MDDRTVIDDKSERITDPMAAKPGDLLVLGQMEGNDFKQKLWLTVNDAATGRMGFDSVTYSIIKIDFVNPVSFVIASNATRTEYPIGITVGDNDKPTCTPLHFDCLIRPYEPFKRGIYKFNCDGNSLYYYFDGKGTCVFLNSLGKACEPESEMVLAKHPTLFPRSCFSLVIPIDDGAKDDDGKKSI